MFERLRKKNLQKKHNMFVKRMIEEFKAFTSAVNASDDLSASDKEELISIYWNSIDSQLRFQSLEHKYKYLNDQIGMLFACLIGICILLFSCFAGGI